MKQTCVGRTLLSPLLQLIFVLAVNTEGQRRRTGVSGQHRGVASGAALAESDNHRDRIDTEGSPGSIAGA